jgi:hypothetical protein
MNEVETLAELVARMRSAQMRYFRERSREALLSAVKLELEVDIALANVFDGRRVLHQEQGELFA